MGSGLLLGSPSAGTHTQPNLPQLQEKSQALEGSMAELVRQVRDLNDHFLALSWRLDLQEQTLTQRLSEVRLWCCLGTGSLGRAPAPLWLPEGGA